MLVRGLASFRVKGGDRGCIGVGENDDGVGRTGFSIAIEVSSSMMK